MITVTTKENGAFFTTYRKFYRLCFKGQIVQKVRNRRYHVKPTTARRLQKIAALRRNYARYKLPNKKMVLG